MNPLNPPPIAGTADPEYQTRIDAARVTQLWKHGVDKRQAGFHDTPLFRGSEQRAFGMAMWEEPIEIGRPQPVVSVIETASPVWGEYE